MKRLILTVILSTLLLACVHALPQGRKTPVFVPPQNSIDAHHLTFGQAMTTFGQIEPTPGVKMNLPFSSVSENPNAVLTRALLAQLVYIEETFFINAPLSYPLSYNDLSCLVTRLRGCLPRLEAVSTLTDVDYNHPNGIAIYYVLANGLMIPQDDNAFGAESAVNVQEFNDTLRRLPATPSESTDSLADAIKELFAGNHSELAKVALTNLYKKASCALAHPDFPKNEKTAIRTILDEIKNSARKSASITDVIGSKEDPNTHVYKLDNNLHFNDVTIASRKPGTDPVEIALFADTHFNYINAQDEAEQNPSIMSTKQHRTWLANAASVPCVNRLMEFARYSDQTVVAGDILDFLSYGGKQLTVENLFRKDVSLMACLGGHDITRVMQGKVADPTSLESRRKFLSDFWINDIIYDSRVIKDKVMVVVMDNGLGQFYPVQAEKLKVDIEMARKNNWIILIAVHEPLCTRNPENKDTQPFMKGDPDIDTNFFDHKCCRPGQCPASDAVFDLIVNNADVVRGVFNGHEHSTYYTWFNGTYTDETGRKINKIIPQHTVTCCIYRSGYMSIITVK